MALPRIEAPTFTITLPISKKQIKFRPFLVKEQKILFMAMESGERDIVEENIKQILQNCAVTEIDINTLPIVDIEYYFLNLRAKSVGEIIESKYKCNNEVGDKECGNIMETSFNINDIKVEFPENVSDVIQLTNKIGVKMKYPDFSLVSKLEDSYSITDMAFEMILNCIEYVFDEDAFYYSHETPKEELMLFLESLTKEQFDKIQNFVENVPKLKKQINMTCSKCGYKHSVDVEGLQDFFV